MERRDAFGAYTFIVKFEGADEAYFRSCSGLKSEGEVTPVQEGGVNGYERKLIGRTKFPNIVLKQGFAGPAMWNKRAAFASDEKAPPARFNGTITQMGPGNKPAHTWQFIKAWICKWDGPEFDASKNEISFESIEIAHEGLLYMPGAK